MREVRRAVVDRRSCRPAQDGYETILVEDELATAMPTLPQRTKATRRTTMTTTAYDINPTLRGQKPARRYQFRGVWMNRREIADATGWGIRTVGDRINGDEVSGDVRVAGTPPRKFAFRGEQLTVRQIADRTGLSLSSVYRRVQGQRFYAFGELQDAVSDPRINEVMLSYKGRSLTRKQWSRETGLAVHNIKMRIAHGWTIARTLTTPVGTYIQAPRKSPPERPPSRPDRGGLSDFAPLPRGPATPGPKIILNETNSRGNTCPL
jgi:hypothetical protein